MQEWLKNRKILKYILVTIAYIAGIAILIFIGSFFSCEQNQSDFLELDKTEVKSDILYWTTWAFLILTIVIGVTTLWYKPIRITKYSNTISVSITLLGILIPFLLGNIISLPISLLISCILFLFSVIISLLAHNKRSYHFYDQYQDIEKEYEHIDNYKEKELVQNCVKASLNNILINLSKFDTHYHQGLVEDKVITPNKEEDRTEFFHYNFKNAHDYIFLSNHKEIVYDEIFADIFYNVYKKVSKGFLSPLVFETNTKVPEFISKELDNVILNIDGVLCQKNTSKFSLKNFYQLNREEQAKSKNADNYKSQRLFIYKNISDSFNVETGTVDFIPPKGLNQETNSMNIPVFLWILEWHEQMGIEVRFIPEEKAKKEKYSRKDISTLDFSITHIKKPENDKFIDIILQIHGDPHKESFYNMDINYYSLTAFTTKEYDDDTGASKEPEHYNFFNKLWEEAGKSNANLRSEFMKMFFFTTLSPADKKNIEDILNRILPNSK